MRKKGESDMLKHIKQTKEDIWNTRFESRMNELGLSQRKFISIYKERFGTGSQADVSKWMHVGEIDGKSKRKRGFPAFETMRNIADVLGVSVGYLIGETDYESFEMERVSKCIGLSESALIGIRNITSGKVIPPFYKYGDPQITAALENLLLTPQIVDYLKGLCELAEAMNREQNPTDVFERTTKKIPESYRDDAIALWADAEEAVKKGIEPTPELWAFANMLDDAACEDMYQPDMSAREIRSARYALQEIQIKLVDELISDGKYKQLLPHYATKEELEAIIRKQANSSQN